MIYLFRMKNYIKNYFSILTRKEKKQFIILLIILFVNSILEFISLGALFPILQSLISESFIDKYFLNFIFDIFKIQLDSKDLTFIYLLIFLFIFFIKTVMLLAYNNLKWTFITNLNEQLSSILAFNYLNYDLEKVIQKGSVNLIKTLDTELELFSSIVTDSFLNVFNSLLLILTISFLVLLIQPIGFLGSLFVFFLFLLSFNFFTKKKIKNYGEIRFESSKKKIKIIQNIFRAIKEIKIFNSINFFYNNFCDELSFFKRSEKKYYSLLQSYKPVVEFFAVLFIFTFLIFAINLNDNIVDSVVQVGILCVGAFRIMPALSSFLTYSTSIKYHYPVINHLKTELAQFAIHNKNKNINYRKINFKSKINLKNIFFKYRINYTSSIPILENINIEINKGDIISIGGATGSGKTTLINLISGFLKPDSGKIIIDGVDLTNVNYILNAAYVSQDPVLLEDSIKRNVAFGIEDSQIDLSKVTKSLKDAEIYDYIENHRLGIDADLYELGLNLSGGQKQRIAISRAYYYDSELFILDEPTSALDKITQKQIINNLLSKNKTIIIISHDEDILSLGKKTYWLKDKSINKDKSKI